MSELARRYAEALYDLSPDEEPLRATAQVKRTGDGQAGGFGLELVEQLAARWGVSHEAGTCVWFELALSGAELRNR